MTVCITNRKDDYGKKKYFPKIQCHTNLYILFILAHWRWSRKKKNCAGYFVGQQIFRSVYLTIFRGPRDHSKTSNSTLSTLLLYFNKPLISRNIDSEYPLIFLKAPRVPGTQALDQKYFTQFFTQAFMISSLNSCMFFLCLELRTSNSFHRMLTYNNLFLQLIFNS